MIYLCKLSHKYMPTILLVEKSGSIMELAAKSLTADDLYKKAGFKSKEGFECATVWSEIVEGKTYVIYLYGKTEGRAGQENKYDFPPPVDNVLFFGTCVLISCDENDKIIDLTKAEWAKIYENLFGGFEDLDDEDEETSEDDTEEKELPRTKEGYVKDGFIVDEVIEDEEEEEEEEEDDEVESTEEEDEIDDVEEEDEEEEEEDFEIDEDGSDSGKKSKRPVKKPVVAKKPVVVAAKKTASKPKKESERASRTKSIPKNDSGNYLNCSDELKEETYV